MPLTKVDQEFLRIPRRFLADLNTEFGFEAVIFGGAVRDTLLGFEPKDIDILLPGAILSSKARRDDIASWMRKNPLTVNNSVSVYTTPDNSQEDYVTNIINASFKGPLKDIKIQILCESNFVVSDYLNDVDDITSSSVLIPQISVNRISCNAKADLFCEDEYMENLEDRVMGVAHNITESNFRCVKRLIRFSATRNLSLDYSAIQFINTIVPWGTKGVKAINEIVLEAGRSKSTTASGEEFVFDPYDFTNHLFTSLGRIH